MTGHVAPNCTMCNSLSTAEAGAGGQSTRGVAGAPTPAPPPMLAALRSWGCCSPRSLGRLPPAWAGACRRLRHQHSATPAIPAEQRVPARHREWDFWHPHMRAVSRAARNLRHLGKLGAVCLTVLPHSATPHKLPPVATAMPPMAATRMRTALLPLLLVAGGRGGAGWEGRGSTAAAADGIS